MELNEKISTKEKKLANNGSEEKQCDYSMLITNNKWKWYAEGWNFKTRNNFLNFCSLEE